MGPRLGGCAALLSVLCRSPPPRRWRRPRAPANTRPGRRHATGRDAPRRRCTLLTGARAIPASNRQQLVSRDSAPCGGARVCAGAARALHCHHISREKKTDIHTRYSCPHPACKLPRTKRGLRVSACSQVTAVQPYRSITFAGAAHSSITSEERPPSPTGVTLCLFSEWKSSASPTCGQGQGQVGGLRGACWARQGSLGS